MKPTLSADRRRTIRWRNAIHASIYIREYPMLTLYIADVERDAGMKKLSREEAAKILEGMKVKIKIPKAAVTQWERNAALDMAIEVLNCSEIPNKSDTISRQAALDAIMGQPPEPHYPSWYAAQIEKLPAAQPATSCSEIPNGSDDTISRRAAIDAVIDEFKRSPTPAIRAKLRLEALPPATPSTAQTTETTAQTTDDWIPVERELPVPKGHVPYLITEAHYNPEYKGRYVAIDWYDARDPECPPSWDDHGARDGVRVTAWRPLPEPYRGGEKDDR